MLKFSAVSLNNIEEHHGFKKIAIQLRVLGSIIPNHLKTTQDNINSNKIWCNNSLCKNV